jgi:hypothetical protein
MRGLARSFPVRVTVRGIGRWVSDEREGVVAIFQRGTQQPAVEVAEPQAAVLPEDAAALRDEVDIDPLVEEATTRLREALTRLDARDEWGRALAWRHVSRIVLGPVLTQLRDSETALRLLRAQATEVPEPEPVTPEPFDGHSLDVADIPEQPVIPSYPTALSSPVDLPAFTTDAPLFVDEDPPRWQ